jgi:hypothetical protein
MANSLTGHSTLRTDVFSSLAYFVLIILETMLLIVWHSEGFLLTDDVWRMSAKKFIGSRSEMSS